MSLENSTKSYHINIQDESFEAFIDNHTGNLVSLKQNGKPVNIEILNRQTDNKYSVSTGKTISNVLVNELNDDLELFLGCRSAEVSVKSDRDLLIEQYKAKSQQEQGSVKVLSPLPGLVTKVEVTAGIQLKKGDCIVVIEAMKMENEISAPNDCIVSEINVEEGQVIEKDQFIALLE
ncbi:MAG: biotin/lipoyl-binding protein [bacterium]|nr:biotin/lipoyl-binding protein [bacterium]